MRDEFGVERPGKYHTRSETYADYADATARRDELNAARHTTGTAALSEQRKAGEMPLGYYARGWLGALAAQVAIGKPKQATAAEYARLLRCYVLPELGDTVGLTVAVADGVAVSKDPELEQPATRPPAAAPRIATTTATEHSVLPDSAR